MRLQKTLPSVLVLTLGGAFATAGVLEAWDLFSPQRTWDSAPSYIVDDRGLSSVTDGDGGVSRTVNAVKVWNSAGRSFLINAQAGSVSGFNLVDGVPMLNFRDPFSDCTGNCLGRTYITTFSQRSNGTYRIDDADIVTNPSGHLWTSEGEASCSNEAFVEGVMVHETGHGLGLAHSSDSSATMYPATSYCDNNWASLASDDVAGIRCHYHDLDGSGTSFAGGIASLTWIGGCFHSGDVDVFRDGVHITTTSDSGGHNDFYSGSSSANYWICDAGSTTWYDQTTCSNVITVSFTDP